MEKSQYNGPRTEIRLEFRGKGLGPPITVPFSQGEVETIRELRKVREGWEEEAMRGSGWTRNLYVRDVNIPWGQMLENRQEALEKMRETLHKIRDVRAKAEKRNIQEVANLADDLDTIENGLLQFLPEEREPSSSD